MRYESIVILTGAGISAESGIATFRASDGLWENSRIEDVATPQGFAKNPELAHRFYNDRRSALRDVSPNTAHISLAELEKSMKSRGAELLLVTQNVDNLHERAGSQNILHMHGQLKRAKCTACDWAGPQEGHLSKKDMCPDCNCISSLRPDIVWFGEIPYHMDIIETALSQCDLFVSIGTSGAVYPAAGFVSSAKHYGAATLELNLERSHGSHNFDQTRLGKASEIVPKWADEILSP